MQNLDEVIISQLLMCLHECNSYVRSFKAADELNSDATLDLLLTANRDRKPEEAHCRQYNLPTDSEVAAIVQGFALENNFDVIIHCRGGGLKRINPVHRSYDPLFYVPYFPMGMTATRWVWNNKITALQAPVTFILLDCKSEDQRAHLSWVVVSLCNSMQWIAGQKLKVAV